MIRDIFRKVLREFKEHPGIPGQPYYPLNIGDRVKVHSPGNPEHGMIGYIHSPPDKKGFVGFSDLAEPDPPGLKMRHINDLVKMNDGHKPELDDFYTDRENNFVINDTIKGMKTK